MPEVDFTQEELDQTILSALERRKQRRAGGLAEGGSLPLGGSMSVRDRLREALQRRSSRLRRPKSSNGESL